MPLTGNQTRDPLGSWVDTLTTEQPGPIFRTFYILISCIDYSLALTNPFYVTYICNVGKYFSLMKLSNLEENYSRISYTIDLFFHYDFSFSFFHYDFYFFHYDFYFFYYDFFFLWNVLLLL